MAPPAAAKIARVIPAVIDVRHAVRWRSIPPSVIATKMGAVEIGLMIENKDEKATIAKSRSKFEKIFIFVSCETTQEVEKSSAFVKTASSLALEFLHFDEEFSDSLAGYVDFLGGLASSGTAVSSLAEESTKVVFTFSIPSILVNFSKTNFS